MARIRSIKPEFWTDGKIRRLRDPSALLFIALWTFADDYGYFACDTLELSLRVPRWSPQSLHKMLCCLSVSGLIRVCSPLHVAQIVGWEHQKIKDRRASKWNDLAITWDAVQVNAQGSDRIRLGVDRIGEERIGEERIPNENPTPKKKAKPNPIPGSDEPAVEPSSRAISLAKIWNEGMTGIVSADGKPVVQVDLSRFKASSKRHKAANQRILDEGSLDHWKSVVSLIGASRFCLGFNDQGWVADFDWLIKSDTHIKVTELKYANRVGRGSKAGPAPGALQRDSSPDLEFQTMMTEVFGNESIER